MRTGKFRWEIFLGLMLLTVCAASILWVFEMVRGAPDVGVMESQDLKEWSLVLILLSITTLFLGSVSGYLLGKYLHTA
jgi:membrane protein YqaA with SNARE-associated domain